MHLYGPTSYFAQSVPEDLRSTAQGILQGKFQFEFSVIDFH